MVWGGFSRHFFIQDALSMQWKINWLIGTMMPGAAIFIGALAKGV
jgi:hypothetical protein